MILQANSVRGLTIAHDWTLGNGGAGYLQGNAAVAQQINCRLLQVLGECPWDAGAGVNWYGWLQSREGAGLSLALATVIINTTNVTGLNSLAFNLQAQRLYSVDWDVSTIFTQTLTGTAQGGI